MKYPDAKTLRKLLDYNPYTGIFVWKGRPENMFFDGKQTAKHNCKIWNARFAGKMAGCANQGYHKIRVNNVLYLAHVIAWIIIHGKPPSGDLDHINMNTLDNRLQNLRLATRSQNMANTRAHKDSYTGKKGVYFDKKRSRFISRITKNGVCVHLGCFLSAEDASAAYETAANNMFGEFARIS